MTTPIATPPSLSDLTLRLVSRCEGGAELLTGDVVPHEVAVGFRVEPRLAWTEALAALSCFGRDIHASAMPGEWAGHVARQSSEAAVPMALGAFPQRVNDVAPFFRSESLESLLPNNTVSTPLSVRWNAWERSLTAKGDAGSLLLAAGVCRAIGDFDRASAILEQVAPIETSAVLLNEQAALLWQRGRRDQALAVWNAAEPTPPVQFNRGMAELFLGRPDRALPALRAAAQALPEGDGWHHLANLYVALAESRL
jgi:tetratricopeptide (TPR) repeat protein